jgi:hypothetical protein
MSRNFAAKIPYNNNLQGYIQKFQSDGYRIANNIDPTGLNNGRQNK